MLVITATVNSCSPGLCGTVFSLYLDAHPRTAADTVGHSSVHVTYGKEEDGMNTQLIMQLNMLAENDEAGYVVLNLASEKVLNSDVLIS